MRYFFLSIFVFKTNEIESFELINKYLKYVFQLILTETQRLSLTR